MIQLKPTQRSAADIRSGRYSQFRLFKQTNRKVVDQIEQKNEADYHTSEPIATEITINFPEEFLAEINLTEI